MNDVTDRPVRLTVSDDLRRSRLTVLFRLLLAIPHYVWLGIWTLLALAVAFIGWFVVLATGRLPDEWHDFIARYVRYSVHVGAYLSLAADPYPGFYPGPATTYPVDVEIDGPREQRRWTAALRILLVIPAALIGAALAGASFGTSGGARASSYGVNGSLLSTIAFLGWFACVFTARMPPGLRDSAVWAIGYGAQLDAYLLLLTDRYPTSDPAAAPAAPLPSHPIRLDVRDELRRSRLTVLLRLPLAIPHLLWLSLWGVAALLAVIVSWFATLVLGRTPGPPHRFLAAYLRLSTHVGAFLYLVGNPFPGFLGREGSYPVDLIVEPPEVQDRVVTAFRIVLAIPALAVAGALGSVLLVVALLGWFASLATGSMPEGLRDAGAYALRYTAQVSGYLLLLTDIYPYSGPAGAPAPAAEPAVAVG